MADPMAEVAPLPSESTAHLNRRESYDNQEYRKQLHWWLLNIGEDPERGEGYAEATVRVRAYLIDQFYRWVWEQEGTYTTWVSHELANDWVDELIHPRTERVREQLAERPADPVQVSASPLRSRAVAGFTEEGSQPRDYLTQAERRKIRDASLSHGSVLSRPPNTSTASRFGGTSSHL